MLLYFKFGMYVAKSFIHMNHIYYHTSLSYFCNKYNIINTINFCNKPQVTAACEILLFLLLAIILILYLVNIVLIKLANLLYVLFVCIYVLCCLLLYIGIYSYRLCLLYTPIDFSTN